ncbi:heterokaryon incompatibility protein-domain-containing protein [Chaetomium strumarium]|uniref:Heterokaryon incompatibility protein-domain-containing protein n=1 Tax=Chaetomium strumarium TaxID=1170767 RepID=A0AAJ0LZ17_9PEZI|nr:heterokaryon incompatibility protein-domain-containing protein [Chaetomium strumarium]
MRLINSSTLELRDFGPRPPPYAILSHTWGDEEVTFQDMADLDTARKKAGFAKIEQFCRRASSDGFDWVWVDTCCIDKTSSAELSESINSMFRWYERAQRCYAFLSDITEGWTPAVTYKTQGMPDNLRHLNPAFLQSRWWQRGWTLQELIAPRDVEFYNGRWEHLTSKRACKVAISVKYGIPLRILNQSAPLASICVAERISWAAARQTTREEDMAYCLLGLLDVNMPLLYGEGLTKAFLRLQEQVIAANEDHSLFLWGVYPDWLPNRPPYTHKTITDRDLRVTLPASWWFPIGSSLAGSPREFRFSPWRWWSSVDPMLGMGEPPQLTSRGLRLSLFVRAVTDEDIHGNNEVSRTLDLFFSWLKAQKFDAFAEWLRPGGGGLARPLHLGAFPCSSGLHFTRPLPCILLLDIHSFTHIAAKSKPLKVPEYARLQCFLYRLPSEELDRNKSWVLRTCYMKTLLDSELRRSGVHLSPIGFRAGPEHLWTWLTPRLGIRQYAYYFNTVNKVNRMGNRWCLHLQATDMFPGAFISVAEQNGRHYWMDCRVGIGRWSDVVSESEAERFATKDLSSLWVELPNETGPVCESRLEFASGSLLVNLYNRSHDGDISYGVYLGFIWRSDDPGTPGGAANDQQLLESNE